MSKCYSDRLIPRGECVLVRKAEQKKLQAGLMLPDGTVKKEAEARCRGIVVAAGPGEWSHGVFVAMPDDMRPGATVMFSSEHSFQFRSIPEMVEENLWFVPQSLVFAIELPEGMYKAKLRA